MKNIVLIGFMGTGKTSTGRMLAARLGAAFIDMDQRIEEETGMSIPAIFEKKGESFFRSREKQLVKRLSARRNAVISTGGGTVKDPENVAMLHRDGVIICLSASIDAVLERTGRRGQRPVLDRADQGDRREAVEKLMNEREALYKQADFTVDTSELSPLQVVETILRYLKSRGMLHA